MKDGIIIQARTGSTRLHNKILLPFYGGKRIIDLLIDNIKRSCPGKFVVLATTFLPQDDILMKVAHEHDIYCYRGSEDDVLSRFIGAAEAFGIDRIIRVCSDNPFLQTDSFPLFFEQADQQPVDYLSYAFADGRPTIKTHLGLFAELTTLDALKRVATLTDEKLYREHVTIYLYTHPEKFSIRYIPLAENLEGRFDLRFTLDTYDDFILLQKLYKEWYETTPRTLSSLLQLLTHHPDYTEMMKKNILQNEK